MNDPVGRPRLSAAVGLCERIEPSTTPPANDTRAPRFKNPRAAHGFRLRTCSIAALGSYVPERVLTNAELAKRLGTTEEWIFTRTGIYERRIAGDEECVSDMAAKAASRAMAKVNMSAEQIGLIIVATNTPDMVFPATACIVQSELGIRHVPAFDLKAAGSAFLYALEVGQQFIASQSCDTVLVIGAEKLSAMVDREDRDTSVLFGDGAGAAILQSFPDRQGLVTTCLGGQGEKAGLLYVPAGGSRQPASKRSVATRGHFLRMDGRKTFKQAVHAMHEAALEVLARCELSICDIQCIIPHQSNQRIIDAVTERLKARPEQVFANVEKYGSTGGAALAIALDEAVECGRVQPGHLVLLLAFGAGLTWGAAVIEW